MATKNSRDVKLTLSVDTLGDDNVKKLQNSIAALAKEGGDAAPEFQRLADEVGRIGQQAQAVEAFRELAAETDHLATQQAAAAVSTEKLSAELRQSQEAANAAGAAQRGAERGVLAAKAALDGTVGEMAKLNAAYRGAERSTEDYTRQLTSLIDKKTQEKGALDQANAAMQASRSAASEAQEAESALEKTYVRSLTALQGIEAAQRQNATSVSAAAAAARELGASTENVAASQAALLQSLNAIGAQADRTATNVRELAEQNSRVAAANRDLIESDRLLAVEQGALADAYRRGQQELDAFGRAQRESESATAAAARAAREQAAAAADMAENNRLWAIQQQAANDMARRAADALDAEKAALRESAQASALYAAAKREEAAATERAAEQTRQAAETINSAFKTVGVRSVQDLNREIAEVRVAMATLASTAEVSGQQIAGAFASGEARIKALERQIREVSGTLTTADKAAKLFSNSMGQITAGNVIADGIGFMVEKVKEMGREFVLAIVGVDQMRRSLNAIYKDTAVTASQIEFLRKTAGDAGVSFGGLSKEFTKFSAAMTSAGVPINESNALFKELVSASAALGLGAEETAGSLNALGQMASKGCHAPGTLIRMADGTVRAVEDIAVGDNVMGPDHRPRAVQEVATGAEAMYRVTPAEGAPFVVNRSHKLRVVDAEGRRATVMLRDYLYEIEGAGSDLILNGVRVPFKVWPVGVGSYHGFVLNGDHLYVDAQGFEHHNTVSMEELRQQLGDRLPGAFGLVAQGLGITQAELVKLVESGNLAARDLFPALTRALSTMKGETDGLVPTFERFKGTLTEMAQNAGDAGWTTVLNGGLKVLGGTMLTVLHGVSLLSEGLFSVGRAAIVFFESLRGNGATAMAWFNDESLKMQQRLEGQKLALDKMLDPQKESAEATGKQATANTALNQSVASVIANSVNLTNSQKLQAVATALAGNTALDASAKYVQFNLAATNLLAAQAQQTVSSKKLADAAKIEGDSLIQIARIRGDQVGILEASVAASEKEQAALEKVAASRQEEMKLLLQSKDQIEVNRVARGLSTEAVEMDVQAIDKKIIAAQGEAEQSRQSAEASRIETVQRKLAAETYLDNSARVGEYRAAVTAAAQAVQMAEEANRRGLATDREVMQAKERLAGAQRLYGDALNDSVAAIDLEARAKAANLQVESANYSAREQSAGIMARAARLVGDNATALYYELEAKRANIEVTRIRYELMRLEAKAELAALDIKKASIPVDDKLRDAKIKEIEIRMQLQKAKLIEAGAGQQVINALESELLAMRNNSNQKRNSKDANDQDTQSREDNAAAIEAQTAALQKQNRLTADGFERDKDGNTKGTFNNALPVDKAFAVVEKRQKGKLTSADLADAQEAYQQAQNSSQWLAAFRASGGATSLQAMSSSEGLLRGAKGALDYVQSLVDMEARQAAGNNGTTNATKGNTTKTVNVVINGRSTPITVASDTDQAALVAMVRQLETAAGASY